MTAERDDDDRDDRDDQPLRGRLRDADPAASLAPADPDRVARLLEATMDSSTRTRPSEPAARRPLTWLVAAAAVLVVGGAGAVAALGGDDADDAPAAGSGPSTGSSPGPSGPSEPSGPSGEPDVAVLAAPGTSAGRCMVPTAEVLGGQSLAVLGTAEEVGADAVTLAVEQTYAGDPVDQVRVEAPAEQLRLLVGAVDFREGEQYLVSATDGRVTVCGFSGPATPALRSLYDEAFPG